MLSNLNKWNQLNKGKEDELLVFGYSCKIFRDDERASYIDKGLHLIPWMGDESLMIDRYDVRGYLHDLSSVEAEGTYEVEMDEEERLCEEERYLALRTKFTEEELYHEEELKRLRAALANDGAYHETEFSYDNLKLEEEPPQVLPKEEEEENEPYVSPEGLTIPKSILKPSTMKIHAMIEKTAAFVCKQGGQMEIIIKMKQSGNPQFAFMHLDNPLHPYYRHLVQEIKAGRYKPTPEKKVEEVEEHDGHYLHPSLISASQENVPKFTVPTINFRRTENDSYSLLVKNLKHHVQEDVLRNSPPVVEPINSNSGTSQQTAVASNPCIANSLEAKPSPLTLSSDSDNSDQDSCDIDIPTAEIEAVIVKMAEYVVKNGEDFETIVKSKNDKRFDFLSPGHKYYDFYVLRRTAAAKALGITLKSDSSNDSSSATELGSSSKVKKTVEKNAASDALRKTSSKAIKGPISFTLKPKETETTIVEKVKKTTALLDDSDIDDHLVDETFQSQGAELKPKIGGESEENDANGTNETSHSSEVKSKKLTVEEMELKYSQEKIKDKLMAVARERLVQSKKDKQLQQERKQKAALFLEMLQKKKEEVGKEAARKAAMEEDMERSPSPEITSPGRVIPISSFPPSPEREVQPPPPNPTSVSKVETAETKLSKDHKRKKKDSHKSRSRSKDKRSKKRSRSKSPRKKSSPVKERRLPAAYAVDRRSPKRYRPPSPVWNRNRWKQ